MKVSLVTVIVILAVSCTALSFSPRESVSDEPCGPNSAGDPKDCDCYPVICSDGTTIKASFDYEAYANITVDMGDGHCVPFGNNSKPKCTAKDTKFVYYVDWDYNSENPYYHCSIASTYSLGPVSGVQWKYPHVKKTYTVRALYCHRTDSDKLCCSPPFIKTIETHP